MPSDSTTVETDLQSALPSRRLAVVFADLAESVRLFDQFERAVIERWHGFSHRVQQVLAPAHQGRVVRTAGDGLLLEFAQVGDAVVASLALHAEIERFNQGQAPEALFRLRIGIHQADVVSFPNELYGAGVNIAARLASLAQPGQTLASAPARQNLADGVQARIHDLGLRFVKHVEEPLRVFRLDPLDGPDSVAMDLGPETDLRPTLAIVPFAAVPAHPEFDALGHALADDLIASMSRHPDLRVLSRASTAFVRQVASDGVAGLRESLGATFVLTGHYYVHDHRARLSLELCELEGGTVLWTGRTVGDVRALFEGEDELVPQVVAEVSKRIIGHELSRARSLPVDALSSYSLYVGASGLMNSLVRRDMECARTVLEHLVERHPRHAAPMAMLARWPVLALEQGWVTDRQQAARQARELCARALDRDPSNAAAHAALATVCTNFEGRADEGHRLNQLAIELDPSDALAWAQLSGTHAYLGDASSACAAVDESLRLSPLDPSRYLYESYAALAYIVAGDYDRAATHAASSVRKHCLHTPGLHLLVGAQWLAGQHEAARRSAKQYLAVAPDANAGTKSQRRMGHGHEWRARFEQALISAGLPP